MKKTYLTPLTEVIEMELLPVMAGSGPGGGDATYPGVTDESEGGPGAGDFGGTPETGSRRYNQWDDEEDEL